MARTQSVDGASDLHAGESVSLSERAYREIELRIVALQLEPGSLISENSLAEELGLGRSPVREALRRLERERLVEIHPRRGAIVTSIDVMRILELFEVRRPLENLVARAGALRATEQERQQMRAYAVELQESSQDSDPLKLLRIHRRVRHLEVSAAHNKVLESTLALLHGLSRRFWFAYVGHSRDFEQGTRHHVNMLEAIARGDADDAQKYSMMLLDYLESLARKPLERI